MASIQFPPRIGGRSPRRCVSTLGFEAGRPLEVVIVVVVVVVVVVVESYFFLINIIVGSPRA